MMALTDAERQYRQTDTNLTLEAATSTSDRGRRGAAETTNLKPNYMR